MGDVDLFNIFKRLREEFTDKEIEAFIDFIVGTLYRYHKAVVFDEWRPYLSDVLLKERKDQE